MKRRESDVSETTTEWNGKRYRSYETERAGKRGPPSVKYGGLHPFPTYSAFGEPSFVDNAHRQYRIGDGLDALEFEKTNESVTNIRWNPGDDVDENDIPGERQFMYVRCPININKMRREKGLERLSIPMQEDRLSLLHLKTRFIYVCDVYSVENLENPRESCGSIVIYNISLIGTSSNEYAQEIQSNLPKAYKKFIKIK